MNWFFTPLHETIRMTPLTCLTTVASCVQAVYFGVMQERVVDAFVFGTVTGTLIGLANMGVHELWAKWKK